MQYRAKNVPKFAHSSQAKIMKLACNFTKVAFSPPTLEKLLKSTESADTKVVVCFARVPAVGSTGPEARRRK